MRLLFVKEGASIWSSHLDLMRALMRAFRRAGIDLKHSQGFTPHPELSILMPLSVGVESQCEIAEFALAEGCAIPAEEIAPRLNPVLPAGLRALESYESGQKAGKLAWLRARLTLTYDQGEMQNAKCKMQNEASGTRHTFVTLRVQASDPPVGVALTRRVSDPLRREAETSDESPVTSHQSPAENAVDAIRDLFARPSVVVEKHGKKGPTEVDIAPMIRELTVGAAIGRPHEADAPGMQHATCNMQNESEGCSGIVIEAVVAAQNPTLNPLLLATAIETYLPEHKPDLVRCRRLEIYDGDMKVFR